MNDGQLRISDAERERAAAELGEHYAQGRLTSDEHTERLDRIWSSRTRAELGPVFADLPGSPGPQAPQPPSRPALRRRRRLPTPVLVVAALLVVLTVATHLPLILIGLVVWFLVSRHVAPHGAQRRCRSMG